jgi:hypothetical protein
MKKILCKISCILQAMGQARAASCLARHGHYEAAKRVMEQGDSCKC